MFTTLNKLFHRHRRSSSGKSRRSVDTVGAKSRISTAFSRKDGVRRDHRHAAGAPNTTTRDCGAQLEEHAKPADIAAYQEGSKLIIEDAEGEVLTVINSQTGKGAPWMDEEGRRTNATGYLIDDEIIVKNQEGRVIRRYSINGDQAAGGPASRRARTILRRQSLSQSGQSHTYDEEETPAERNRRLAALRGSDTSEGLQNFAAVRSVAEENGSST
ncbi:hypothetical protein V1525DRAFT_346060 [Lipomyces kononenkoae]|uniref:Uncharacterized protein n=1 Tax=Lipomyces kononenkoae TaxID=34357 RepID=A0ACC3SXW4_LIPKO